MNITSLRVLLIRPNRIFLWLQISIVVGTLAEWYLLFQEKTQEAPLASIRPGQLRWTCLHSVALLTCPTGSKQNDLPGLAAQAERYLYKVCIAKENDIPSTSTYSAETIALSLSPFGYTSRPTGRSKRNDLSEGEQTHNTFALPTQKAGGVVAPIIKYISW